MARMAKNTLDKRTRPGGIPAALTSWMKFASHHRTSAGSTNRSSNKRAKTSLVRADDDRAHHEESNAFSGTDPTNSKMARSKIITIEDSDQESRALDHQTNHDSSNTEEEEQGSTKPSVITVRTPTKAHCSPRADRNATVSMEYTDGNVIDVASPLGSGSLASNDASNQSGAQIETPTVRELISDQRGYCQYVPTCMAITREGTRCFLLPQKDGEYCTIHTTVSLYGTLTDPKRVEGPDRKFKDEPNTWRCRAVTRRASQCIMKAVTAGDMCRRHIKTPPLDFVPDEIKETDVSTNGDSVSQAGSESDKSSFASSRESSEDSDSEGDSDSEDDDVAGSTPAGRATVRSSPPKINRAMDMLYIRRKSVERCIFISTTGKACQYAAVDDTICCHGHAFMIERLTPILETDFMAAVSEAHLDSSSSDDSLADEVDDASSSSEDEENETRPYKHKQFLKMWKECEAYCGQDTDEIENSKRVRSANQSMCPGDTDGQAKAQYGRLLPRAMKTMMKSILGLKTDDIFLDIGHGIGNTCLQAAFTAGCEARGIEVVYGRNSIAEVFRDNMMNQNRDNPRQRNVGKVLLRHGRLEDEEHRDFLTKGITKAYVNNFNGVFAERSVKLNQNWFLDDYVSGLFTLMAPGTQLVTLHPLNLGPTRDEANEIRRRQGMRESKNASFFTVEQVLLGKACDAVKWNQHSGNAKNIYVYKYTRLSQPSGTDAVFMCCNPDCAVAKKGNPIKATTMNEEDRCVVRHCSCKYTPKTIRRQRKKNYKDLG